MLGPDPGRYVVRRYAGDEVRQVVVVGLVEPVAPARRGRRPGLRRAAEGAVAGRAAAAAATRVTVVEADPLGDRDAAEAWLARAAGPGAEAVARSGLELVDRLVAAHRVAAADPHLADADPLRATAARVGYGSGQDVADGRWEAARDLPGPTRAARRAAEDGRPQLRVAALLAARDVALACEELTLRARADAVHGRDREAAIQLEAALGAALAELAGWRGTHDLATRLDELAGHRDAVAAAAAAAREGRLEEAGVAATRSALARLEAALRARTAAVER